MNSDEENNYDAENADVLEKNERYTNKTMHSALAGFPIETLDEILQDGQVFAPDDFEENYLKWPEAIRNKWTYKPIVWEVIDIQEVVGFILEYKTLSLESSQPSISQPSISQPSISQPSVSPVVIPQIEMEKELEKEEPPPLIPQIEAVKEEPLSLTPHIEAEEEEEEQPPPLIPLIEEETLLDSPEDKVISTIADTFSRTNILEYVKSTFF